MPPIDYSAAVLPSGEGCSGILPQVGPAEILAVIRRRWRWLIVPTLLGAAAAGATVGLHEPAYRSSALLLIEVLTSLSAAAPERSEAPSPRRIRPARQSPFK